MTRAVSVGDAPELGEGARAVREVEGVSILFLKDGGVLHAIENRCPHRGAPLTGAVLKEGCIQCPWHGLRFKVASGECLTHAEMRLTKLAVERDESQLSVELRPRDEGKVESSVRTALVRYGSTGQVGWFGTIHSLGLHRGAQVVVESAIGAQLAEVLIGLEEARNSEPMQGELRGEIVRNACEHDLAQRRRATEFAKAKFGEIESDLREHGHLAVEIEATLDQQVVVVWLLSSPEASLGPVAVELAGRLGVRQVRFLERTAEESPVGTTNRYNKGLAAKDASKEGSAMKGPGLRQKHDLDRIWECPVCQHRERTGGIQTTAICPKCPKTSSGGPPPQMKLVASPPTAPRRTFQVLSNTPVPVPVVSILGEDTARIPKKQALRPGPVEPVIESVQSSADGAETLQESLPGPMEAAEIDSKEPSAESGNSSDLITDN